MWFKNKFTIFLLLLFVSKPSLKVFSLENLKLEKKLEIEKKSNEMLFGFTNGDESDLINGLN